MYSVKLNIVSGPFLANSSNMKSSHIHPLQPRFQIFLASHDWYTILMSAFIQQEYKQFFSVDKVTEHQSNYKELNAYRSVIFFLIKLTRKDSLQYHFGHTKFEPKTTFKTSIYIPLSNLYFNLNPRLAS